MGSLVFSGWVAVMMSNCADAEGSIETGLCFYIPFERCNLLE
jgi:hypothetical protein